MLISESQKFSNQLDDGSKVRAWLKRISPMIGATGDMLENLQLAVSEIFVNVIKHSTNPPSEIFLTLERQDLGLFIVIKDNGSGFPSFKQEAHGLQSEALTTLRESGMGLTIITTLFPQHYYRIKTQIESAYNEFGLCIKNTSLTEKEKIALVDDDDSVRAVMEIYLNEDYEVKAFANALSAIEYLKTSSVDLVLSDIYMPDMDGITFRQEIAKSTNVDILPFIFLTASEDVVTQEKALELGVDDYLVKPVRRNQLLSVIKRVLTRTRKLRQQYGKRLDNEITSSLKTTIPAKISGLNIIQQGRVAEAGGGDFLIHIKREEFDMLILGDIMGHGEQAKFFAHAYVGYLHGLMQSTEVVASPGECLKRLSEVIDKSSVLDSTMLTCIALKIDHCGHLTLASAGHPPPILIKNGTLKEVPVSGGMPGLMPEQHYEDVEVNLAEGRLAVFTDGLFEAARTAENRMQLEKMIKSELVQTEMESLPVALETIFARFDNITGNQPTDDATLMLLSTN